MPREYTPEEKSKLEFEKLEAEVADLRSWVRRWLGTLGGLLGIVTAAISVMIAIHQNSEKVRTTDDKSRKADTALAQSQKLDAERASAIAVELEKETKAQVAEENKKLGEIKKEKGTVEKKLADEQALVAKISEERRVATEQRDKAQQEYDALQRQVADVGRKAEQQGGQAVVAREVTAIAKGAEKTIEERKALIEDRTKARLFFFVTDEEQKARVWALAPRLEEQKLYLTNVLVNSSKREETTVVRYFRYPQDKEEAEKIDGALKALGLEQSRVSYVVDPDSVGSGRKFQIWVKKGDFAR